MVEQMKKSAATVAALIKQAWNVFCGIDKDDQAKEVAIKVAKTVSKGTAYAISDYLLIGLSALTVVFFKWLGWEDNGIIVVMWIEDAIVAYGFVLFSQNVVEDFTLTEAIRLSIGSIRVNRAGRIVANILTVGILIRFSLWDGPERIVLFFHKELKTQLQKLFVVIAFALIQAVVWTKFYSLGIDGLTDMWKLFF